MSVLLGGASRTQLNAQSVCEAELVGMHEGFLLGAGIRESLHAFGIDLNLLTIKTDNMAAKGLSEEGSSWRTRHFAVKAEGLREQIALELAQAEHVPAVEQRADGFTKALPIQKLIGFLNHLGLIHKAVETLAPHV